LRRRRRSQRGGRIHQRRRARQALAFHIVDVVGAVLEQGEAWLRALQAEIPSPTHSLADAAAHAASPVGLAGSSNGYSEIDLDGWMCGPLMAVLALGDITGLSQFVLRRSRPRVRVPKDAR
jgi:hypothetical protein